VLGTKGFMKVNRRELGALAFAAAAAVPARALAQNPPAVPQTVVPRDFLAEARQSHQDDAAALARIDLPQSVEPAFEFRP
jgi:hypothetical protein